MKLSPCAAAAAAAAVGPCCCVQTFSQLCQWQDVLQQMFQATGLPYMAVIANKADTDELAAAAAELHAATSSIAHACR
jgi:hypothetical protein